MSPRSVMWRRRRPGRDNASLDRAGQGADKEAPPSPAGALHMPIPPAIDPRLLAAEIEASVAEFNRLVNLADQLGMRVVAELHWQATGPAEQRPILAIQVIAPL